MANTTVYPYGTGGSLPSSIGIINDLITGGVDKALSAQQGVVLKKKISRIDGETTTQNYIEGAYYTSTGSISTSSSWARQTDFLPINLGDTIEWNAGAIYSTACLVLYSANKARTGYYGTSEVPRSFTVPETGDYAFLRISFSVANKDSVYIKVNGETVWTPQENFISLSTQVEKLEVATRGEFAYDPYVWTYRKQYYFGDGVSPDVGANAPSLIVSQDTAALAITCSGGDMFFLNNITAGSGARAWCFVGGDNKVIQLSEANLTIPSSGIYLTAPEGATTLYLNDFYNTGNAYKVTIPGLGQGVANFQKTERETRLEGIQIIANSYVIGQATPVYDIGEIVLSAGANLRTNYINIEGASKIRTLVTAPPLSVAGDEGVAFYDKDKNCIKACPYYGIPGVSEIASQDRTYEVPAGAVYVIITIYSDFVDDFYLYVTAPYTLRLREALNKSFFARRYSCCKDFGEQPAANGSTGSFCNIATGTYDDLLEAVYEPLRSANPNYISRTNIGKDASGTIDMYAYEFTPRYYSEHIYLQAGIHGNEPDSVACLARIMQLITNATNDDPDLLWLRQQVRITVIPCVNVWGISQSSKRRDNSNSSTLQAWNSATPPQEVTNIKAYIATNVLSTVSYMLDMHTTTNNTYKDFYGNIQPHAKNVRTVYRTVSWLCDNYAKNGATVDDQYIGYHDYENNNLFRLYYYYIEGIETATLELSDYYWDSSMSTSTVITMGVTMWLNYIIQMANDYYKEMFDIPNEDYRESRL